MGFSFKGNLLDGLNNSVQQTDSLINLIKCLSVERLQAATSHSVTEKVSWNVALQSTYREEMLSMAASSPRHKHKLCFTLEWLAFSQPLLGQVSFIPHIIIHIPCLQYLSLGRQDEIIIFDIRQKHFSNRICMIKM